MSKKMKWLFLIAPTFIFLFCYQQPSFATSDSTLVPFSAGVPNTIIFMNSGYINFAPLAQEQQSFLATGVCPTNFSPYVFLELGKIKYASAGQDHLSAFGICVNTIQPNPLGYVVGYLTSRIFISQVNNSNAGRFVGLSNMQWTGPCPSPSCTNQPMPPTQLFNGFTADQNTLGGIHWQLYCFPPGIPRPNPPAGSCVGGYTVATNPF